MDTIFIHFDGDTKIHLFLFSLLILLQTGSVFYGKQATVDVHAKVSDDDRRQHYGHWRHHFNTIRSN